MYINNQTLNNIKTTFKRDIPLRQSIEDEMKWLHHEIAENDNITSIKYLDELEIANGYIYAYFEFYTKKRKHFTLSFKFDNEGYIQI